MATFGKRVSAAGVSALPTNKRSKINIYDAPPSDEVSMDEFEQFALDRMRVLKAIDQGKARGMKPDELNEVCLSAIPLNKHHLPSLEPPHTHRPARTPKDSSASQRPLLHRRGALTPRAVGISLSLSSYALNPEP
jgi:hypothetical protein